MRTVKKDQESFNPYAHEDMYTLVAYYTIGQDRTSIEGLTSFTRNVVDELIKIKGTYYLPYGSYYTSEQLQFMYPAIHMLSDMKKQYDPGGLFSNNWYEKYF